MHTHWTLPNPDEERTASYWTENDADGTLASVFQHFLKLLQLIVHTADDCSRDSCEAQ